MFRRLTVTACGLCKALDEAVHGQRRGGARGGCTPNNRAASPSSNYPSSKGRKRSCALSTLPLAQRAVLEQQV